MRLLSVIEFLGHFHPLLVHLPLGILLIALLLQWMSRKSKYVSLIPAIPVILLAGSCTAFASCITGYLLSISDDYDKSLVSWHMWMGIGVALVSLMLYAKEKNPAFAINKKMLSLGLLVLLMITGHLGGSLTHGSDYLTKPFKQIFNTDSIVNTTIKPISNVQESVVYTDIVTPILQTRCYSCHNANKQKGGLRMDEISLLMKGGKDGKIIMPGNAGESELMKRLLLPTDNEHHMPPKEKPQLTESQISLLHWWISYNADAQKKAKEFAQTDKEKYLLTALQTAPAVHNERTDIPATPVARADEKIIEQLKDRNILILPVAQNTNYLQANFVSDSMVDKKDLQLLVQLKQQLIWLKLHNTNTNDEALAAIGQLINLTRLDLSNTFITDKAISLLANITNLQYLNLSGTKITEAAVASLKKLPQLQSMYLYNTALSSKDKATIKQIFTKTTIDTGGYLVPFLKEDTTLVKEVTKKK
ncbi:c-type cytochrome domain-containing protein [Ferruginibacter sp.]|uniref:c-type cytochrome domain-containing protein n=1 Tax=Ferruginibacter sp. TaxID=1940288 RepID=UPI0026599E45|nr:c-type cytochrome domain-containing protein [Ferruginibacter sp.]